jgi:hypothetical protein
MYYLIFSSSSSFRVSAPVNSSIRDALSSFISANDSPMMMMMSVMLLIVRSANEEDANSEALKKVMDYPFEQPIEDFDLSL